MKQLDKLLLLVLFVLAGSFTYAQPLNGNYTVYGAGADYANLQAAANDLNNKGMSGPVVFKIRPGVHTSSTTSDAYIQNVSGASATNTITFEAENGDASTTEIRNTNTSTSNGSNYIFRLNDAKYVRVRNLTLNKTYSYRGRCFYFQDDASYNIIENCILKGSSSTSTSNRNARIYADDMRDGHHNIIRNNTINGGGYGIYWYGNSSSSSNQSHDNEFINNTLNSKRYGIRLYYCKDTKVNNNTINSTNSSYFYGMYLRYCDKNMEVLNNKGTITGKTSTTYGIYMRYCDGDASNRIQVRGNEFTMRSSSTLYTVYNYYCSYMDYEDNIMDGKSTRGYARAYLSYLSDDMIVRNNDIKNRSDKSYAYTYAADGSDNVTIDGNIIYNWGEDGSYVYAGDNCEDYEVINNDITSISERGYCYGLYAYTYSNENGVIANNKVYAETINGRYSYYTTYGIYTYYPKHVDIYNNAVYINTNRNSYGSYVGYPTDVRFYNNTIYNASTSSGSNYGQYIYWYSTGSDIEVYNNIYSGASGNNTPLYLYNPDGATLDYNNYYKPGNTALVRTRYGTYNSIQSWRNAVGQDMNSLTYEPGYMNASGGDLRPDPTDPNSWSMNGRGVQMPGNDEDMNGNPRALTTVDGVPDLGAYEFTPTSTPPNCDANPAAPAANTDQVFTFGEDTVAVMKWGATVPTGYSLKQYTGTNPPGILSINPTQMFFYVDAGGSGTNLDYEMDLYYKDPWMGTIASESALRLAENVNANGWSGYSPVVSGSNTTRNFINTPGVQDVGALFTGIDVKDNASADAIIEPVSPFCPGSYTVKVRILNNGNNKINSLKIAWELNGASQGTINYNSTIDINGSSAGNEAVVTLGTINFGKKAENIKVWTFDPNGNQDPIPADDTLDIDYRAALQGTYTVGGTTPDFVDVVTAASAVSNYGTCGDVVFDIRPGTYTDQIVLEPILRAGSTNGRVTFQAENGNRSSVTINYATSSGDYSVLTFNGASDYTVKDLTVIATGATYGRAIELKGDSDDDSIVNCVLKAPSVLSTSNSAIYAYYSNSNFKGSNLVIKDNELSGGYYTLYLRGYNSGTYWLEGVKIDGNTFYPTRYAGYVYYTNDLEFTDNIIDAKKQNNRGGVYLYYTYQSPKITGNDIDVTAYYGMYIYRTRGNSSSDKSDIRNNSITMESTTNGYYGMYMYAPRYANVFNNSINVTKDRGCPAYRLYSYSSTYRGNTVRNNVFVNTGGGLAMDFDPGSTGYDNTTDYNNLYTTGSTLVEYDRKNQKTLSDYRSTSDLGEHSISYEPGFMSANNLHPDKNNPASWSLNGRAVHIQGNDMDADGNPRVESRPDGVPDIGAFEFNPEVQPPLATATPAQAGPGVTQEFTFGEVKVATVTWDANFPLTAPLEVRQYSGEKGNGVAAQAAPNGSMYFYTDIEQKGNGTTYKFNATVNYMDIWLGDIATESDLRLAHKYSSNYPWMVYNGNMSTVNTTDDILSNSNAMSLHHFGAYTGLADGSVLSAFVVPQGSIVICTGNSVQLNAEPQTGDSYQWYRNGTLISGATATTYQAGQAGDYSVAITYNTSGGTKVVESVPVTVSVIAPPNALVNANGPLTYCVGNGLTLDAGAAQGVDYQWQLNGQDIPGATDSTYKVNQAGNYTVVVTNIGCSSTSTVTPVSSGPLTVNLGQDTSYCEVDGVYAQLDAGYPGADYLWNTGDTTKTIEVRNSGNYWVEVDGGPNCRDRDTIGVTISPLPTANGISYVKNGSTFFFSPSGAQNTSGYMWLFSDGSTSTQRTVSKSLNSEDLYVRLVLFNSCGTDTVQLGWPLSVDNEIADNQSLTVYPNPAKQRVNVSVNGTTLEEIQILNSVGSIVYRAEAEKGTDKHQIDLSNMANGHYMLRARTADGIISKPFDIMK